MVRNTKPRALVWVKMPAPYADVKYGFNSGADSGDRAILGQTLITPSSVTGLVIGANNIKPGIATKRKASGTESSFYGEGQATALKTAKWTLTRPKIKTYKSTKNTTLLYVTINGVAYGWRSTKSNDAPAGANAASGAKFASQKNGVVYGASFPKPPRVSTLNKSGGTFSTFADPTAIKSIPAEWSVIDSGKTELLV